MSEIDEDTIGPDDLTLLDAVSRLWQQVDPPPGDLVDGVLARIAAEDLEFDLLVLVESSDARAGVRSATGPEVDPDTEAVHDATGSWQLEYAGSDFKIYLRMTRIEHRTRIDGWVVPARPLTVRLLGEDDDAPQQTVVDEFGRFELPEAASGLARLAFLDDTPDADRPRITPPFWI